MQNSCGLLKLTFLHYYIMWCCFGVEINTVLIYSHLLHLECITASVFVWMDTFFFSWTSRWLSFFQKYIKILRIYHLLLWMTCFSDSSFPLFKNKACNYCLNTFECICLSLVLVVMSEFSFTSDCLKNFICPFDTVVSPSVSS